MSERSAPRDSPVPLTVAVATRRRARGRARPGACADLLRQEREIRLVADVEADTGSLARVARLRPHVLLLECPSAADCFLAEAATAIQRESPRTRMLLVTRRAGTARLLDALSLGVRGYVEEQDLQPFLVKAVRAVDAGEAWVPRRMVGQILERLRRLTPVVSVSQRLSGEGGAPVPVPR